MRKSPRLLLVLSFIIFLVSGCSKDKLKGTLNLYSTCSDECDKKEAQYLTEYNNCRAQCSHDYLAEITLCVASNPPGPQRGECTTAANNKRDNCSPACDQTWETHQAELKEYRGICLKKITILAE